MSSSFQKFLKFLPTTKNWGKPNLEVSLFEIPCRSSSLAFLWKRSRFMRCPRCSARTSADQQKWMVCFGVDICFFIFQKEPSFFLRFHCLVSGVCVCVFHIFHMHRKNMRRCVPFCFVVPYFWTNKYLVVLHPSIRTLLAPRTKLF